MKFNIDYEFLVIKTYLIGGKEPKLRERQLNENKSQTEISNIVINDDHIEVTGYQSFKISKNKIYDENRKLNDNKKKTITQIITDNKDNCSTIFDFGCSQGFYSFFAYFQNYSVKAFDHDPTYVNNLQVIKSHFNFDNFEIIKKKFSDVNNDQNADICLFLALIHWVYKCTDNMGSLKKIINKLFDMTNKILIIEWIDPQILNQMETYGQYFEYVDIQNDYNLENFENCLKKFKKYEIYDSSHPTRKIYVCYK